MSRENSPLYIKSGMGRPADGSPINLGLGAVGSVIKGVYNTYKGYSKTKKYVAGATTATAAESTLFGSKVLNAADDWFLFGAGKAWKKGRSGGYLPGGGATITPYNPDDDKSSTNISTKNKTNSNCNDKRCLR